jgi:hypothetical protein
MIATNLFTPNTVPTQGARPSPSHPLSRGLTAAWLLQSGGTIAFNLAATVRDLTDASLQNSTFTYAGTNRGGKALEFPTNLWLNCGDSADLAPGTGDFTMSAWCYPYAIPQAGYVWSNSGSNVLNFVGIYFWSDGKVYGECRDGAGVDVYVGSSTTLAANTWYHVLATRSGGTVTLYLNGASEGSSTNGSLGNVASSDGATAKIGAASRDISSPFNGIISTVMLWNRALSAQDVRTLYQQPYAMFARPLWVPLSLAAAGRVYGPAIQMM